MSRAPAIAVINGKGGSGKTATAVALAAYWSHSRPVALVDLDPQDTGSAEWWLDRVEGEPENLTWVAATPERLSAILGRLGQLAVIDTPPRLEDRSLVQIAGAVDLVVIPGAPSELASIAQAAKTVAASCDTPAVAVLTRASTVALRGSWALSAVEALEAIVCPVVGQIRQYSAMATAPFEGRLPEQLTAPARIKLSDDIAALASAIEQRITIHA